MTPSRLTKKQYKNYLGGKPVLINGEIPPFLLSSFFLFFFLKVRSISSPNLVRRFTSFQGFEITRASLGGHRTGAVHLTL